MTKAENMTLDDINRIASEYLNDCESTFEMEELFELAKKGLAIDAIKADIRKEMIESGKSNVKEYGINDPYNKYEQCFLAGVYRCLAIIDKCTEGEI